MSALGHKRTFGMQNGMSALPSKADICSALAHVRFVPIADNAAISILTKIERGSARFLLTAITYKSRAVSHAFRETGGQALLTISNDDVRYSGVGNLSQHAFPREALVGARRVKTL
jgi:hypothetical protein